MCGRTHRCRIFLNTHRHELLALAPHLLCVLQCRLLRVGAGIAHWSGRGGGGVQEAAGSNGSNERRSSTQCVIFWAKCVTRPRLVSPCCLPCCVPCCLLSHLPCWDCAGTASSAGAVDRASEAQQHRIQWGSRAHAADCFAAVKRPPTQAAARLRPRVSDTGSMLAPLSGGTAGRLCAAAHLGCAARLQRLQTPAYVRVCVCAWIGQGHQRDSAAASSLPPLAHARVCVAYSRHAWWARP